VTLAQQAQDASQMRVNGATLLGDPSGALVWPDRETVVVADLHLEKGSALATGGHLLPPYDTAATLTRLRAVFGRHKARRVICLGDSFHDQEAGERLSAHDHECLRALTAAFEWIWIRGNHDPQPPESLGGVVESEVTIGGLVFRHQAEAAAPAPGEVSGHYHPKASVRLRAKTVSGRCFVTDGRRLILPAFGAYAGGLSVLDQAIQQHFPQGLHVHLLGRKRTFRFPASALVSRT